MTDTATLGSAICYSGRAMSANWEGRSVADRTRFERFVREVVELKSNLVYGGSESSEAQAASFC